MKLLAYVAKKEAEWAANAAVNADKLVDINMNAEQRMQALAAGVPPALNLPIPAVVKQARPKS